MIILDLFSSDPHLIDLLDEKQSGNFMCRPVQWVCQIDKYELLRKVFAVFVAFLLICTVIGVVIVVPGIIEWRRQAKVQDVPSLNSRIKSKEMEVHSKGKEVNKKKSDSNSISKSLAGFDNLSVKGKVNGIYITTNETNLTAADEFLKRHPSTEPKIHIGCAGWHNFDIMCKRKSDNGLIIDFNPKNADFIKKTVEIIKSSATREIFKSSMIAYLNALKGKEREVYFHSDQKGLPTEKVEMELLREGSWLHDEESYLFIKNLVLNNRIVAITENIVNYTKFHKIREFLDSNHISIDTVYLSNICNFMRTISKKEAFSKSIKHIVGTETLFISCPKIKRLNNSQITILHQNFLLGKEVLDQGFSTTRLFEVTE